MCKKMIFPISSFVSIAIICLTWSTVVEAEVRDPVSFWRFEEGKGFTTADIGFGNHPGTLVGSVAFVNDADRGSVLEFGMGDSYVDTNAWITELGPADFSITAWIKTREPGVAILGKSNGDKNWAFHEKQFYLSNGTEQGTPVVGGVHFYGSGAAEIWGATPVNDGQWHHVCVTWTYATATRHIYVDGKLDDLNPVWPYYGGRGDNVTDTVRLGFDCSGDAVADFIGRMDDVAIFNVTLTQQEIAKWMTLSLPATASAPYPGNGVTDLPRRGVVLSWQPGVYAASHDVYFGTNFADVNTASRTNPLGVLVGKGQTENYYPTNKSLDFDFGTTCYWRVDEVNAPPSSAIVRGEVWSFTTEAVADPIAADKISVRASSNVTGQGPENTINSFGLTDGLHSDVLTTMWLSAPGAALPAWIEYEFDTVYKLAEMRVWNHNGSFERSLGLGCKSVLVEYSLNGTDFTTLGTTHEFARATGKPGYACNTTVDFGGVTAKYVRLTINSNWGGLMKQYGLSEVRFLYLPVRAREPSPISGSTNVDVGASLSWRAGREAGRHNVYLSTNQQAVIDGTAPVKTATSPSYAPALDLGGTYYWRVDEANDAETPTTWQGDVWSFSTQTYAVVDDFESYGDDKDAGKAIYQTWVDGYGTTTNGSQVGYIDAPFEEHVIVRPNSRQSMPLKYDNTSATNSQATRTFASPQDWSKHGIKGLTLWFYGDPTNVAQQMYVKINNTRVPYDGAAENLRLKQWQMWYIPLASLNVSSVTTLSIGFDRIGTTKGQGLICIDDIRLYSYARQLVTPKDPGTTGLQAQYPFEGNVNDSSGRGHNGTLVGGPTYMAGKSGQAINLDGTDDYVNITGYKGILADAAGVQQPFTVCAWIKTATNAMDIVTWGTNVGGQRMSLRVDTVIRVEHGNGNIRGTNGASLLDDEWHHVAATVPQGGSIMDVRLYTDGGDVTGVGSADAGFSIKADVDVRIGMGGPTGGRFFKGLIDDVRIYSRVLSAGEIAWVAGRATPFDAGF